MSEHTIQYQYTDEDGDVHKFNHVSTTCRCCMHGCSPDRLEYFCPIDDDGRPYRQGIEGSENKMLISDLIEMALLSGKLTKVEPDGESTVTTT